ncbi:alpha-amylase family glycosyl hydrolase [Halalkalibacillus sediminis]|nr:alpha-amylase family glycosyl hydrolase [Halalkalibacillus sediminis]
MKLQKIIGLLFVIGMLLSSFQSVLAETEDKPNQYYYILVDRYQNSEDEGASELESRESFMGGDFQGISERLDHLETIGVTHLVLSPVFSSEDYLGNEVKSFDEVQETYGSKEDLQNLVEAAHERDMKLILEFPHSQVSESSALQEEEWVEDGDIELTEEAQSFLIEKMNQWKDELNSDGFYFKSIEQAPDEFWSKVSNEVGDQFLIGEPGESSDKNFIDMGFDRILNTSFQQKAEEIFKDTDTDFSPLLDSPTFEETDVVQYMDHIYTDRFTRASEDTGYHPITRWKLALTYLYTTPNEPWLFHGTEVPTDGIVEDGSHHKMVNYMANDDQLSQHVEKLSDSLEEFEPLRTGDIEILHEQEGFIVYSRSTEDETVYIAINNTPTFQSYDIEGIESDKELRGITDNDLIKENDDGTYSIGLNRELANVYTVHENRGIYWPLTLLFVGGMGTFIAFVIIVSRRNKKTE